MCFLWSSLLNALVTTCELFCVDCRFLGWQGCTWRVHPNENPWVNPWIMKCTVFGSGWSCKYSSSMSMLTGVVGCFGSGTKSLKAGFVLGFVRTSMDGMGLFAL